MNALVNPTNTPVTQFSIVVYDNMTQKVGKQLRISLEEFSLITTHRSPREDKWGKLFSLAFGSDSTFHQHQSDIAGVSGLVVDFDVETEREAQVEELIKDVELKLQNCAFGVYTTHSHDKRLARLRCVVPTRTPLNHMNFYHAFAGLVSRLDRLEPASVICGQIRARYPFPGGSIARQDIARGAWFAGELIDTRELIEIGSGSYINVYGSRLFPHAKEKHLEKIALEMVRKGEARDAIECALIREEDKFVDDALKRADNFKLFDWAKAKEIESNARDFVNNFRRGEGHEPLMGDARLDEKFLQVDIQNLAEMEISAAPFAIDLIVPSEEVTLLSGHGGTGKSMLALTLAAHFAARQPWAGLAVKGGKVLYVNLEDSASEVQRRLKRIAKHYKLNLSQIENELAILDGSVAGGVLVRELVDEGVRKLVPTNLMKELRGCALRARLIIIDNASNAYQSDENNREMVTAFVAGELRNLARTNRAGVLLLAHVDKQAVRHNSKGNTFVGSTAWHNAVRSRLALRLDDDLILLVHEKSNLGRKLESIPLGWTDDGVLVPTEINNRDDPSALFADTAAIIAAMRAAMKDRLNVTAGAPGTHFPQTKLKAYAELPKHLRGRTSGRDRFWRAFNHLISTGQVVSESYKTSQRRQAYRFVLKEAAPYHPHTPST